MFSIENSEDIVIVIVGSKTNDENYWNGRWRSEWSCNDDKIVGRLDLLVHYYEDGNVVLSGSYEKEVDISEESGSTGEKLVGAIRATETEWQTEIDEKVKKMTLLKGLRKNLPVFKTRVDWTKIANYKISSDLAK